MLRLWVIRHGVISASRGGKLKTLLQAWALGLLVLPHPGVVGLVAYVLMGAALVVIVLGSVLTVGRRLRRIAADLESR